MTIMFRTYRGLDPVNTPVKLPQFQIGMLHFFDASCTSFENLIIINPFESLSL